MPAIIFIFGDPIQNTYSFKINHGNSDSLHWMVLYLWSPKKKISLRDQRCGFSHSRVSCGKRFITVKNGIEKASDTDIRRGQGGPQSLVWVGLYTIFQLVTNNRKVLPDPLPQHSFQDNRISQKYFLSPPARYIVVI